MPVYEFLCPTHGRFEELVTSDGFDHSVTNCPSPHCSRPSKRVMSVPAQAYVKFPERMRYGNGSPGKIVPSSETGGLDLFIPSGGAMDKSEIDDVAAAAIEKEKARVKNKPKSANSQVIGQLTHLAYSTKPKDRIKTMQQALKESGLEHKIKLA